MCSSDLGVYSRRQRRLRRNQGQAVMSSTAARDLIVDGLRMSAAKSGEVVSAGWWGKVKTVLQMLAIALLLLHNWPFALIGLPVAQILLWAACAASLYSGWIYFEKLKKYVLETM